MTSEDKNKAEKTPVSTEDYFSITKNLLVGIVSLVTAISIGVMLFSALQFLGW
jgi:hypothetical protein